MTQQLDLLEKRISLLESQNRRLKWLGVTLAAVAMTIAAASGKTAETVVKAQKFELHDGSGHLRAELAMLNGGPALRFFDEDGDVEALLGADSFNMFNKDGEGQTSFGKNGAIFEDSKGNIFVSIAAYKQDQMGKITLRDFRSQTYVTITPKDLQGLLRAKAQ